MKRLLAVAALIGAVASVAALLQHLDRDRQFRRLLTSGEAALAADSTFEAIEAFSGAVALRPEAMVAWYRRGEAYSAQRRDDAAIRDFHEAIRLAPEAPQPYVALGDLYDLRNNPAEAAEWYAQAAERLHDSDPGLLYTLALARYRAGMPAAAIDPLRRAIARNDSFAEAHYLIGLVYRDAQDTTSALASLEKAVRLAPNLVPAREELADLYGVLGRHVDEMLQLQALLTLDQGVDRRLAIARTQTTDGQFDGALGTLADASAAAPGDSRIELAIGRVYLSRAERSPDKAEVDRALGALERALGGTARRSEGLALLGRALYLSGDYSESERILREAVATSPVDPEAFGFLADSAERLTHYLDARDALRDLDALEGDIALPDARAHRARRIGALSLKAGDARAAADYLSRALDGGVNDADTLGLLAEARWQAGDASGARTALNRALELSPRSGALLRLTRVIK
jgi:tetratricopeptide (TPR) repeat protein